MKKTTSKVARRNAKKIASKKESAKKSFMDEIFSIMKKEGPKTLADIVSDCDKEIETLLAGPSSFITEKLISAFVAQRQILLTRIERGEK